ncbi:hypothetical protein Xoosp13_15 [Xanthomonas phage Xoo-sp13]|nr:hypothetical protein Xoosp13_15 [Xanthomonas phage Xoo-sp13]
MSPYIIIRVLSTGTYYFTNNDGEDHTMLSDGTIGSEVVDYANSVIDAKTKIHELSLKAS